MGTLDTSIAAASAAFSGFAALAAWRASKEANATASSVAQIERDRWHRELTPLLRLKLEAEQGMLYVRFDGPAGLGKIDVRLTLRDDFDRSRVSPLAGIATPEEMAQTIWGPYRFRPRIDGADDLGRTVAQVPLEADDRTRLAVDPSVRPSWYEGTEGEQRWRHQYRTTRIRLWADCEAEGHKPWRLSFEVPQDGTWAQTGRLVGT
ncbi:MULTISPECIES: hypothetical protein [Streptomyces]|uniref:Uncharacterized protein n=1 Tax=Streptomyces prasinus TaxID=67345 RepID=A0ABX6ARF7_9ACTN|nr:hypothetical protein [Streptomyces prasinus]QEV04577.1 hypothetical protein CP972_01420 [Streptomyces prasinus]